MVVMYFFIPKLFISLCFQGHAHLQVVNILNTLI